MPNIQYGDTVRPASGELRLGHVYSVGILHCEVQWQDHRIGASYANTRAEDLIAVTRDGENLVVGDIVRGRGNVMSLGRILRLCNTSGGCRVRWCGPWGEQDDRLEMLVRAIAPEDIERVNREIPWPRPTPAPTQQRQRCTARPVVGSRVEYQRSEGTWYQGRVRAYHDRNGNRVWVDWDGIDAQQYFGTAYAVYWDELWLPAKRKKGEPQFRRTTPKVKKVKPCLHKQGVLVTALGKSVCSNCLTNV